MAEHNHLFNFLFALLFGAIALVVFIILPFFAPLILAAVFAFLFQPVYKKILHIVRGRQSLAALTTTIVAVVLILLPVFFLAQQIFSESKEFYNTLTENGSDSFTAVINDTVTRLRSFLPIPETFTVDTNQYLRRAVESVTQNLGAAFSSVAKLAIDLLVFLMAFFFLLKDGKKLKDYLIDLSPLNDKDDELIVDRLKLAVSSVVKGNLLIGMIQGSLTGIGFALFGVPNPVLWGIVAALAALIPGVGTALVIIPGILYLYFTRHGVAALGMLLWGIAAVGLIDNLLGPKLIGKGMKLHPLAVFLAVLGGLALFGPLGFLLGPLAMSLCLTLIDIYFSLRAERAPVTGRVVTKK